MVKLTGLSAKEHSGEQPLKGVYHVVVDVKVESGKNITIKDVQKKLSELGEVEGFYVEKFDSVEEVAIDIGETIELTEDLSIEKPVYLDTKGNLVITDSPVARCVECVGNFAICLTKGTVAEVNKTAEDEMEILFSGTTITVAGLNKEAYLGILKIPNSIISRYA